MVKGDFFCQWCLSSSIVAEPVVDECSIRRRWNCLGRIIATSKYYGKSPDNFLLHFKNAIRAWVGEAYNLLIKYDVITLSSDTKC